MTACLHDGPIWLRSLPTALLTKSNACSFKRSCRRGVFVLQIEVPYSKTTSSALAALSSLFRLQCSYVINSYQKLALWHPFLRTARIILMHGRINQKYPGKTVFSTGSLITDAFGTRFVVLISYNLRLSEKLSHSEVIKHLVRLIQETVAGSEDSSSWKIKPQDPKYGLLSDNITSFARVNCIEKQNELGSNGRILWSLWNHCRNTAASIIQIAHLVKRKRTLCFRGLGHDIIKLNKIVSSKSSRFIHDKMIIWKKKIYRM